MLRVGSALGDHNRTLLVLPLRFLYDVVEWVRVSLVIVEKYVSSPPPSRVVLTRFKSPTLASLERFA